MEYIASQQYLSITSICDQPRKRPCLVVVYESWMDWVEKDEAEMWNYIKD